jgi:hypothetical protein
MGKLIGGVVVGYITMFVAVFVLFSAGWGALGADGSFQPGSWDVSFAWVVLSIVVGLVAAIAGGYVCVLITDHPRGAAALAGVVFVLGILMAVPVLLGGPGDVATTARPETVGMFDAMSNAKQPTWIALLNPLLGVVGVFIGARLKGRSVPT